MRICAENPIQAEYSLCGDAFDIVAVDPNAEDYMVARPGNHVTCEDCMTIIMEIHTLYTINGKRRVK